MSSYFKIYFAAFHEILFVKTYASSNRLKRFLCTFQEGMEKKHAPDAKLAKFTIVEVTFFYYFGKIVNTIYMGRQLWE